MTDQQLRQRIHQAMDNRLSGVERDPFLEKKAKAWGDKRKEKSRRPSLRVIIAVVIALLSILSVGYTAMYHWNLKEYLLSSGYQLPQDFESGFDQDLTQEFMGFRFHIRDAYMNGDTAAALVEISRLDNAPGVFLYHHTDLIEMNKSIRMLHADYPEDITVGEYIEKTGLPVFVANSTLRQKDRLTRGSGDFWMEGERMMVYYTTTEDLRPAHGEITLDWEVNVRDEQGKWHTAVEEITLPAPDAQAQSLVLDEMLPLEDMMLQMKAMQIADNPLGLEIRMEYVLVEEKPGDKERASQYRFQAVDPDTYGVLPDISGNTFFIPWQNPNTGITEFTWDLCIDPQAVKGERLQLQLLPREAEKGDPSAPTLWIDLK